MILSPHEIAWLVIRRWKDPVQQRVAIAVFLAESSGDTEALGRSIEGDNLGQRDHGLTQVSGRWHGPKLQANSDWRDPEVSVALARQIWEERKRAGKNPWGAWSVFTTGAYERFLPDADVALLAPFPPPPRCATVAQVDDLIGMLAQLQVQVDQLTEAVGQISRHFAQEV